MTSGNTVAKAVLYMKKGVPNKIIELIAADRKPLKKMKLAVDCKSTDELVADKVFSEMEQTVVIIGGGADGIIELEGFVATLCTLPRWLQMFILAYKEPLNDEDRLSGWPTATTSHVRAGMQRCLDFDL